MTNSDAAVTWLIVMLMIVGLVLFVLAGNSVARMRANATAREQRIAMHCALRGLRRAR